MRILAFVIALMLVCGVALAGQTGTTWWHSHSYIDNDRYNEEAEEYKDPLGLGVDVKVLDIKKLTGLPLMRDINVESRYDFNNEEASCFIVMTVDLTELYQK